MMGKHGVLVASAAVALTGCAPIEQAPLVYSSKQQFGVGVTAGTPENPGLDVNIGYKGLDAAFVPVAVAKHCPKGSGKCDAIDYNLTIVRGKNASTRDQAINQHQLERTNNEIDKINAAIDADVAAIVAARQSIAEREQLGSKIAERDRLTATGPLTNAPVILSAEDQARLPRLEAEIQALDTIDVTAASNAVAAMIVANEGRAAQLRVLEEDRQRLELQAPQHGEDKSDGFSVYGSFNGGATGSGNGAALSLGKVFSTGVAAQLVSQGVKEAAIDQARANCLQAAAALTQGRDDAVVADALSVCRGLDR